MAGEAGESARLRERIARALWAHDPPFTGFPWDDAEDSDEDKAYYLGLADAVIADLDLSVWRTAHDRLHDYLQSVFSHHASSVVSKRFDAYTAARDAAHDAEQSGRTAR